MPTGSRIARGNAATVVEKVHVKHQSKRELRASLLKLRATLSEASRRAHDAAIGAAVTAWLKSYPVQVLGVYWPIRGEPDLREVYPQLIAAGVRLALPVMVENDAPLVFAGWAPGEPVEMDRWGIATPTAAVGITPQALLIPCVGYDGRGFRIGYGAGFYDRTLAHLPQVQAIGIAYTIGRADFEVEPHDRAMDVMITETAVTPE